MYSMGLHMNYISCCQMEDWQQNSCGKMKILSCGLMFGARVYSPGKKQAVSGSELYFCVVRMELGDFWCHNSKM